MQKVLLLLFLISFNCFAEKTDLKKNVKQDDKTQVLRSKIGPTLASPVEYNNSLYFLATTGTLYKTNLEMNEHEVLMETGKSSVSGLSLYGDSVYFGEGIHSDQQVHLYSFDLKKKKLNFKIPVEGHIEKEPILKGELLYVAMGKGGLGAFNIKTKNFSWKTNTDGTDVFHIDGVPVFHDEKICVNSVYEFKGIVCFNDKTGKVVLKQKMKYSAKSELGLSGDVVYGYGTEANVVDSKWDTPSVFFIYDLKNKKMIKEVELRGFNFYSPLLMNKDEVFVSISTGDLITISLKNGQITYVSEFPEPFLSNTFIFKDQLCAIGAMGKILCYKRTGNTFGLSYENRFFETPIGRIGNPIKGRYYIPSRLGFFNL